MVQPPDATAHRLGPVLPGPRVLGARGARALILFPLALLAVSCAPATPRFEAGRLTRELRQPLADWVSYWRAYDPAFALDSLRWTLADTILVERTEAISDSLRTTPSPRGWAWSPDRSRVVDPNWYREWDPDRNEYMYEPDAVTELLDFTTRTGTFLQFCGTGCRNDAAFWLDRERFALVGWTDTDMGDSLFAPRVTVYDLERRTTATGVGRGVAMRGGR